MNTELMMEVNLLNHFYFLIFSCSFYIYLFISSSHVVSFSYRPLMLLFVYY